MKRAIVLCALLATGVLSLTLSAGQQAPAAPAKVIEVEKLRDTLYLLKGGGGNTAVFVGSTGVVVVDTKLPEWGQPILDKIKTLTPKPVTMIINTHSHWDHVSGNVEFPANIDVVVHENTKTNMEKMAQVSGNPVPPVNVFKASTGRGVPTRTFKDRMTVGAGGDRIDLYYFGRGHTDGDTWVVFPALRAMHAGDIFSGKNVPLLDANNGGSGLLIADSLAKAVSAIKNVDTIITGHSTQMTMADLAEYVEFNRDFVRAMQEAKRAGQSVDDVVKSWKVPAKYKGYSEPQAARLKSNVEIVFNELR